MEDPALITAWATVAIAIGMGVGGLTACLLIWQGLRQMRRSSEERARERREWRAADLLRHKQAMEDIDSRRNEAMEDRRACHSQAMTELEAPIARISPVRDRSPTT